MRARVTSVATSRFYSLDLDGQPFSEIQHCTCFWTKNSPGRLPRPRPTTRCVKDAQAGPSHFRHLGLNVFVK
jgi:hypothetical protein